MSAGLGKSLGGFSLGFDGTRSKAFSHLSKPMLHFFNNLAFSLWLTAESSLKHVHRWWELRPHDQPQRGGPSIFESGMAM